MTGGELLERVGVARWGAGPSLSPGVIEGCHNT